MTMTLELPEELQRRLEEMAQQQHKTPEEVVASLLREELQTSPQDEHRARVQAAGDYIERKNAELYRRLA